MRLALVVLSALYLTAAPATAAKPKAKSVPLGGHVGRNGRGDKVITRSWMTSLNGRMVYSAKTVTSRTGKVRSFATWKTKASPARLEQNKIAREVQAQGAAYKRRFGEPMGAYRENIARAQVAAVVRGK